MARGRPQDRIVAIVIELLIPLGIIGLIGWGFWLWYRLRLARAAEAERMQEELSELRAYKSDTEARLQALETIATLGEGRMRVDYKELRDDDDEDEDDEEESKKRQG